MSYEVLVQEVENKNEFDENEEVCLNIENKIILLGNNSDNVNEKDIVSDRCDNNSVIIEDDIEKYNCEIKHKNQNKCIQCGNHLINKRTKYKNYKVNTPLEIIGNGDSIHKYSSQVINESGQDEFLNCLILFIAGFILFLPWLFTFHYLGSPLRKCRIIAIISICLLGLFFIVFTLLLSIVVVLVSNPELLTMMQKYWLENNYNHNYY